MLSRKIISTVFTKVRVSVYGLFFGKYASESKGCETSMEHNFFILRCISLDSDETQQPWNPIPNTLKFSHIIWAVICVI